MGIFIALMLGVAAMAQPPQPVFIVPFDGLMYHSMVDKELAAGTKFKSHQVMEQVRDGLTRKVMLEFGREWKVREVSIHDSVAAMPLPDYIHKNITYEYIPLVAEKQPESKPATGKIPVKIQLPGKGKQKDSQPEPGARIENGEVVAVADDRDKFMNTVLLDSSLTRFLATDFGAGSVFFINQLDIEMVPGAYQVGDRRLVVHFTWMNTKGAVLKAGKYAMLYDSLDGTLQKMLEKHIPAIAQALAESLSFTLTEGH
jgi:hypothetical protein